MSKTVSSRDLRAMFDDREELALLDAREERDFATAHILYASCLPYGRIEERAERLFGGLVVLVVVVIVVVVGTTAQLFLL